MIALQPVLLTIHTICVMALVGVVLLQRSEGGALGMGGGGGGGGGMMSGRGAANALTKATVILAAAFFLTSMLLAITSDRGESQLEALERITGEENASSDNFDPAEIDASDILGTGGDEPGTGEVDTDALFDPTVDAPGTDDPTTGDDQPDEEEDQPQRG